MASERQARFRRNEHLEDLLQHLNHVLQPAETRATADFHKPQWPVVLVVGAPRSGTTLTMQWLARSGQFAYPSNLLSRFYANPYLGALINKLIGDPTYDFGNELSVGHTLADDYRSELGKTVGIFQPNEFWYFWRRFIPNDQPRELSADELQSVDIKGFQHGIASLQAATGKPWAMKGIILQYNLEFLSSIFDSCLILFTQRAIANNARSLYEARKKYYGDASKWFSVKPPGYERLIELTPYEQVVGQVEFTNRSIHQQLEHIDTCRYMRMDYEEFCRDPQSHYEMIREKLKAQGFALSSGYTGPAQFAAKTTKPKDEVEAEIQKAIRRLPK